jgi:hypothetical protein
MGVNDDDERYIEATTLDDKGQADVAPLAMSNAAFGGANWHYPETGGTGQWGLTGGSGLNNVGLLVRVCGRVTYTDAHNFTLDDGSKTPIHCVTPSDVTVDPLWQYAAVTGICSCERIGSDLKPKLLVRSLGDIQIVVP